MNSADIKGVFRREAGRVRATLIRLVGDFSLAEEGLQDAFAAAVERWPASGIPDLPRAWLVNVGRNRAIDRLRRQILIRSKQADLEAAARLSQPSDPARSRWWTGRPRDSLCSMHWRREGPWRATTCCRARADLLRRLGREAEAVEAYQTALRLVRREPERRSYQARLREISEATVAGC